MGQILHKCAKTTHIIRAEIQRSSATIKELSQRYNINPKTVLKWEHRKTQLSLDDCFIALKPQIPALSPSNLH